MTRSRKASKATQEGDGKVSAKISLHLAQKEPWLLGTSPPPPQLLGELLLHPLPTRIWKVNKRRQLMWQTLVLGDTSHPSKLQTLHYRDTPSPRILKVSLTFTLENESILGRTDDFMGLDLSFQLSLGYSHVVFPPGHSDPNTHTAAK